MGSELPLKLKAIQALSIEYEKAKLSILEADWSTNLPEYHVIEVSLIADKYHTAWEDSKDV